MKPFFEYLIIAIIALACGSCTNYGVLNRNCSEIVFSDIKSDYALVDLNNYGCHRLDKSVLKHILKTGTWITQKDIHDFYSTTGCTVKGSVKKNSKEIKYIYDYGGIMYFGDGKILGCGQNCCRENYHHCSYDKGSVQGF